MAKRNKRAAGAALAAVILVGAVCSTDACASNGEAQLILRAVCTCGGEIPEDGSLTFVLWDGDYRILQMVINLREQAAFAPLQFDSAERYVYYISQEAGNDPTLAYDPSVYQVVVSVEEGQEGLTAQIAEINRVRGDNLGEAESIACLGAGAAVLFENVTRQVPLLAQVPQTGDDMGLWVAVCLISAGALAWLQRKTATEKRK